VSCLTLTREITTFTDKRELDKDGNFFEIFHSDEGLKEYIRYLDVNREPIIAHVISMDNEKEIPVEVALIYNTSYTENIFLT
jgi:DNA gyrase subunit B